jgi:hypothetical protein
MDQGEGVQHLEGGAHLDHPPVAGIAARSDERPMAERRAQPLAAGQDQPGQRLEGDLQLRVHRRPPLPLALEELPEAPLDRLGHGGEARWRRHGGGA